MSSKNYMLRHVWITTIFSLFFVIGLWATTSISGWLIVLDGTSSSGKSSVARHLKRKLFKQVHLSFSYESLDDFNTRKEEAEAQQEEAKKSQSKAAVSHKESDDADVRSDTSSKSESSKSEDNDDEEDDDDSQADYLQYIKDLANEGKYIIADTVLRDEQDIKEYKAIIGKGKRIICAMVYCPAIEVPRRVEARNLSGDKDEKRTMYQAIAQIPDMFTITKRPTKHTIDQITKKEIEQMLNPLKKELENDNKKKRKEGKKEDNIPHLLHSLRSALAPKKGKYSYIQPKMHHDVVAINSRRDGPAVAAQKIADHVIQRMYHEKSHQRKRYNALTSPTR
jgi:guanylate kinase